MSVLKMINHSKYGTIPNNSEQYFQSFCHFIIDYLNLKIVCNELSFYVEIKAVG